MREACKHPGGGSRFFALLGRAPAESESAGTSSSQLGHGQNDGKAALGDGTTYNGQYVPSDAPKLLE